MRKVNVLLKVLVIALVAIMAMSSFTLAYDFATNIKTLDGAKGDSKLNKSAENIVGAIISAVKIVALGVAIIMLTFVAIKYMSSAPGDRAEIKKHAVIYVVGAVVLFATSGILSIIQNFASTTIK